MLAARMAHGRQPILRWIATFVLGWASLCSAADSPALLLERALYLETTVGDADAAARLYEQILDTNPASRAKAEAAFHLAELRFGDAHYADARHLYFRVIREFSDADDLVQRAEDQLVKVTALLTREEISANPAAPHRLGDLAIGLLGALENKEFERAGLLLQKLDATLLALTGGGTADALFVRLRAATAELTTTLKANGPAITLAKFRQAGEFEPLLNRQFPADPMDVFAPAWRLKDRLTRALAANNPHAQDAAQALMTYLSPVAALPTGFTQGALARMLTTAAQETAELVSAGKFTEARIRVDQLDEDRYQQFPFLPPVVANSPVRLPENLVSTGWTVLFRAEQARRELSSRQDAVAMDNVEEAISLLKTAIPTSDHALSDHFRKQITDLQSAYRSIQTNLPAVAQAALRRVAN